MRTLQDFNERFLSLHVPKEDLFWKTYMGHEGASGLDKAEAQYAAFLSDPKNLETARAALGEARGKAPDSEVKGLQGWVDLFSAHCIESPKARQLQQEVIELESRIFEKRSKVELSFTDEAGNKVVGTTNTMSSNIAANPSEGIRRTSHEALLGLEEWVSRNGFPELVRKRNELARELGYPDYFHYKVAKNERMTGEQLSRILDDFEERTRESCFGHLKTVAKAHGENALLGHNLKFAVAGDVEQTLDPYFPFEKSLERWWHSFSRLGIEYRGATLSLDLLDRKGKYENGFMHGPQPCYYDGERWQPARINFTSNANPRQVGSGREALMTLFHEGGHAAHFSNILMNSPCYSQEFPPTSMAYAETQSMFCDSLVGDADWLWRYARTLDGQEMDEALIEKAVTTDHPFEAFRERSILVVSVYERRLYGMKDDELTAEAIIALARTCEKEILGVECSPRPLLAVPHLLGADSSCAYHGYLLAHMAVYQTRAALRDRLGSLADNPEVGQALAQNYWAPGNSVTHDSTVRQLTGKGLSGDALADHCNLTVAELWAENKSWLARAKTETPAEPKPLNADIFIVHGSETLADNRKSEEDLCRQFEAWIAKNYPPVSES